MQGLADAGGDGGGGGGGGRKEPKTNPSIHNGLLPSQPLPKRPRNTTPNTKMPRMEPARNIAPVPITRVVSPQAATDEEDPSGIVEVDPGDNPNVKNEGWSGEDTGDFEIATESFEQDMQAEDEQYIQAGNDALSGQQVNTLPLTTNTHEKTELVTTLQIILTNTKIIFQSHASLANNSIFSVNVIVLPKRILKYSFINFKRSIQNFNQSPFKSFCMVLNDKIELSKLQILWQTTNKFKKVKN